MEDGATVEWIIQALDGGWGHRGWIIQALEGSARREVLTRPTGEADTAAQVLAGTFGDQRGLSALLISFHGRWRRV